jgi:hypothetical protein
MSQLPPELPPPVLPYNTAAGYDPSPVTLSYKTPVAADRTNAVWVLPDGSLACRDGAVLPHLCVVCGSTDGLVMKRRELTWVTPLVYLGLLLGILPAVIMIALMQKKTLLTYGLCAAHRAKNVRRIVIAVTGILLIPITIVAAVHFDSPALGFLAPLALLATLLFLVVVRPHGLACTKIENQVAYMKGACPMLLKIVQNTQDAMQQ